MKKVNTFGIQFIKNGEAPIYVRITVNTNRCEISVKRRIHTDNWNNGKGMAKGKNPEISKLNSYLEQIRSQLTNHYQDLVVNKQEVTPDAIKNFITGNAIHFVTNLVNICDRKHATSITITTTFKSRFQSMYC